MMYKWTSGSDPRPWQRTELASLKVIMMGVLEKMVYGYQYLHIYATKIWIQYLGESVECFACKLCSYDWSSDYATFFSQP